MTFSEWKKINRSNLTGDRIKIMEFSRTYPQLSAQYVKRLKEEAAKVQEIMSIKDRAKRREAIAKNPTLFGI